MAQNATNMGKKGTYSGYFCVVFGAKSLLHYCMQLNLMIYVCPFYFFAEERFIWWEFFWENIFRNEVSMEE